MFHGSVLGSSQGSLLGSLSTSRAASEGEGLSEEDIEAFRTLPFNLLINGWGLTKQAQKAEAVLHRMLTLGVAPDALSYQCVIYAWQGAKEAGRAQDVLEMMQQAGVTPNPNPNPNP